VGLYSQDEGLESGAEQLDEGANATPSFACADALQILILQGSVSALPVCNVQSPMQILQGVVNEGELDSETEQLPQKPVVVIPPSPARFLPEVTNTDAAYDDASSLSRTLCSMGAAMGWSTGVGSHLLAAQRGHAGDGLRHTCCRLRPRRRARDPKTTGPKPAGRRGR
jgi:hypothetical protein